MSDVRLNRRWHGPRLYALFVVLLVLCFFLVAVVRTARRDWSPIADNAVTWMRAWDVGTRHTPLVGPHSRLGFHHPGPMMFYWLALPLRLFWGKPSALLVGALVIAFVSAIGTVALTARFAGSTTALGMGVALGVLSASQGARLIEPWNPFLIVLPFAVFLVAAWFASAGHFAAAPIAAVAGTLAAQSHLGALPPVVIVGVTALFVRVAWPPGSATRWPNPKRALLLGGLLALLWLPPVLEQLTAPRGNITNVLSYFGKAGTDAPVGWRKAWAMAGTELLPWGPWMSDEPLGLLGDVRRAPAWALPVSFAPLVVALALAVRFRDDLVKRLVVLETAAALACFVALAQIRGLPFYYLMLWSEPVAMLGAAAPVIVLVRKYFPSRAPSAWDVTRTAVATAFVAIPIGVSALRAEVPTAYWSRVHSELVPRAVQAVSPNSMVRVVAVGPFYTGSAETIVVALERTGRAGKLMPWYAPAVGEHRIAAADARVPTLVLATGIGVDRVPHRETGKVLYQRNPIPESKHEMITALRQQLEKQLVSANRRDLVDALEGSQRWLWLVVPPTVDQALLNRYLSLTAGYQNMPVALFSLPPTTW